ncbi:hypothetical protein EV663_1231, partial [Rhodovulum bhavnagarense]
MAEIDATTLILSLQPAPYVEAQSEPAQTISADMFGAIQTGFQHFSGFEEQSALM